ncbi:MAG: LolA-like outer membrane lipoprotein chaperone [Campylobacterales bacterium]
MRVFFLIFFLCMMLFSAEIEFDTLKSKFAQTITSLEGSKIDYSGEIYIKAPTDVLWIYKEPTLKKIFVNSQRILSYEPILEQATIINIDETNSLTEILSSAKKTDSNNYITNIDGIEYTIELDKNSLPSTISYSDKLKNSVTITFLNPQADVDINSSVFNPSLPQGTDIIR